MRLKTLLRNIVPEWLIPRGTGMAISLCYNLLIKYGWYKSIREGKCVDCNDDYIPWFTYPAIDYLKQIDFSEKSVFEWGAGYSTIFWAKRAKKVISVETEEEWYKIVRDIAPSNCKIVYAERERSTYVKEIDNHDEAYDVIVIDGTGETRLDCCGAAIKRLLPGGIIILDDADLWLRSARVLREADLIQIDFTGFGALSANARTTSIFVHRNYCFRAIDDVQPQRSVAQTETPWPYG